MKRKFLIFALILLTFASCKKDDPAPILTLSSNSVSLYSNGTGQLIVNNATTEKFTYISENTLIASVDDSGMITGKRVGETTIKVSGNDFNGECKVAIMPLYNTFVEPTTTFGISKIEVKAIEKRDMLTETETIIIYEGSLKEKYAAYFFENNKLIDCAIIISSTHTSVLGSYMAERYNIVSLDPIFGYSVDDKFMVLASLDEDLDWFVFYSPNINKSISIKSQANILISKYKGEILKN